MFLHKHRIWDEKHGVFHTVVFCTGERDVVVEVVKLLQDEGYSVINDKSDIDNNVYHVVMERVGE